MKLEEFKILAKTYNLIPVYEKITADLLTPVLAYLKIRENGRQSFLLESVEGPETVARYSFIGIDPEVIISNKGGNLTINENGEIHQKGLSIFEYIRQQLKKYQQPKIAELPDFTGGLVGYLGYENISLIEPVLKFSSNNSTNPDSILGDYKTILVFDHFKHQIILISNAKIENNNIEESYLEAKREIKKLKEKLNQPVNHKSDFRLNKFINDDFETDELFRQVEVTKKNIYDGDIFQLVISKRFSSEFSGDPVNVYRALRIINPSPYMYFLEFKNEFKIIGTSPEDLLKIKSGRAQVLPIAGTRKRGANTKEEIELEKDLINDPKEIAEHTMLLDLGRNDLGRVCEYGTVEVTEKMKIQKYSHVMHLVSKVEGNISKDKDSISALMSCFPAGTVSGAPKIRAMQLINDYEKQSRNVYAGAIGYFDYSGNLDMCIAIRTLFSNGNKIYWQSGAGIVADSKPELEAKEIKNKSASMVNALKYAEVIDENTGN